MLWYVNGVKSAPVGLLVDDEESIIIIVQIPKLS